VSNFQPDHLDRIIGETGIAPVVNQIEVHPEFSNSAAEENIRLFDFELSVDEMATIDALDKGEAGRIGPNSDTFDRIF
jgi:diketogulonate reductase-like aldo/keto reductase